MKVVHLLRREHLANVRRKSFIISTLLVPILIFRPARIASRTSSSHTKSAGFSIETDGFGASVTGFAGAVDARAGGGAV